MLRRNVVFVSCVLLVLASAFGRAAISRDNLLVSTAWLAQHAADPDLVLLHVGDKVEYDKAHIPGARFVSLREISRPADASTSSAPALTLEMSPPDTLRAQLEALGVSDSSHVVVYYGKDTVSPTTRVIVTLMYAGLTNVSLLDGGMTAWTHDGHAVTDVVPEPHAGSLKALQTRPLVVDAEFVRAHANTAGFAVVDSRDKAFYDGSQEGGPRDHRKAGHIPGAHNVPFSELTTADLKVKSSEELAKVFQAAGVNAGDTVITYCHIGQQATATLFGALLAGHQVLLYDGSFEDWARRDLPVENPAQKN
jgi:thiosulfate/3-mercaptopyruvate sulfurtransferase